MIIVVYKDYAEMVAAAKEIVGAPTPEEKKQKAPVVIEEEAPSVGTKDEVLSGEGVQEQEEEEEVKKEATDLTIEDIREVFVEKNSTKGNTAKLKAILKEFKVSKVTDLEEKDFDAVMARLKEI